MKILRTHPHAKHDFLQFQIGRTETRYEQEPVYDEKRRFLGHRTGTELVSVFRLLGFGSTLQAAEAMAARAA